VTLLCHVLDSETVLVCAAGVVPETRGKRRRQQTMSEQSTDSSDVSSHQTSVAVTQHAEDTPSASVIRE